VFLIFFKAGSRRFIENFEKGQRQPIMKDESVHVFIKTFKVYLVERRILAEDGMTHRRGF